MTKTIDVGLSCNEGSTESQKESWRRWAATSYVVNKENILARSRAYYAANKGKIALRKKEYIRNNPEVTKEQRLQARLRRADRLRMTLTPEELLERARRSKEYARNWRLRNLEDARNKAKAYYRQNKERIRKKRETTPIKDPEAARATVRRYYARTLTVEKRIHMRMKQAIRRALKCGEGKKRRSTFVLLGYTVEELRAHLESKFTEGMSWDLFMAGHIEIDHYTPLSWHSFTSTDDPQFRQAWGLHNLQPLWKVHNRKKSNRYAGPYREVVDSRETGVTQ